MLDNAYPGHVIADPNDAFGQDSFLTARQTVATHVGGLEMRRFDDQRVTIPASRGETFPRVQSIWCRVWPTVHPDRAYRDIPGNVGMIGDRLQSCGIDVFPDSGA